MSNRNNIEARLYELNRPPNIPLSYRAYAIYEVENPQEVEKHIHSLFDVIDENLHAREKHSPVGASANGNFSVYHHKKRFLFSSRAQLRGDIDYLKRIDPNQEQIEEEQIAEQISRRPRFKFSMLQMPVNTELQFLYDETCICMTKDDNNKIEYEGNEYTLSGLAQKLLVEKRSWKDGVTAQGPKYFTYQGNTLSDLRDLHDNEE